MKLKKKKNYNLLKLRLINEKRYKILSSERFFQFIEIRNLELQIKKLIKLFYTLLFKNRRLKNFLFINPLSIGGQTQSFKKLLLNFSFLKFCLRNSLINFNSLSKILKVDSFQFNCSFYTTFFKKYQKRLVKVFSTLTNVVCIKNVLDLKKIKNFYSYSYLVFWDSSDLNFFFRIFKILIRKVSRITRFMMKRHLKRRELVRRSRESRHRSYSFR